MTHPPLVTLAVAGALDALFLPGLRVVIPDMVRFEVTRQTRVCPKRAA